MMSRIVVSLVLSLSVLAKTQLPFELPPELPYPSKHQCSGGPSMHFSNIPTMMPMQGLSPLCFTYCMPSMPFINPFQMTYHGFPTIPTQSCGEPQSPPAPLSPSDPIPSSSEETPVIIMSNGLEGTSPQPDIQSETTTAIGLNKCQLKTAQECVSDPECRYCLQAVTGYRCDLVENFHTEINGCDSKDMYSDGIPTTSAGPTWSSTVDLPLIPNVKRNFSVEFEMGNIPLDLYALFDFSYIYFDFKSKMVALSPKIVTTLDDLHSDATLGFASYVDKPVSPLGSPSDYSVWNQLPLSKNSLANSGITFTEAIANTKVLNGMDPPDGVIDALFQIGACGSKIGWRNNSRKIIFTTAHQPYHVAGDGTSYGLKPFDIQCHLNATGRYTEEAKLDYPSLAQLSTLMEENNITIVFALTEDGMLPVYKELSSKLKDSKVVMMDSDAGNMPDVLKSVYNDLSKTIKLENNASPTEIEIAYYSDCGTVTSEQKKTDTCQLPVTGKVRFLVEVELKDCVGDKKITLHPAGTSVHVNIDVSSVC